MRVDLDAIERVAKRATPGEWKWDPGDGSFGALQDEGTHHVTVAFAEPAGDRINISDDDAEHIAQCSPDAVLALVDVARAATALIDDYRSDTPDGGATTYALCKAIDRLRGDDD